MDVRRPLSMWKVPPWPADGARTDSAGSTGATPVILLYHSVVKTRTDPWGVRVKPRNFGEQMAVLRAYCNPLRLVDLDAALSSGKLPPRSVIVTFDDGYVDNLVHAKPAMQRHQIPGTVFVSSGYIDQPREYWWDEIERLILQPGTLPRQVSMRVGEREQQWDLDGVARYRLLGAWRHRRWFAWEQPPTPRHRMFCEGWAMLRAAPSVVQRERAIDELRRHAKPSVASRATHRCCTRSQLRELALGGLIEIGAHTVNHPSLGHIGIEEQRREIIESKATLEGVLQMPVTSFSYPFGTRADYSDQTISLLKSAGIARACSNFPEPLTSGVDRYQYPRRVVMDWSGEEFLPHLAKWFSEHEKPRVA